MRINNPKISSNIHLYENETKQEIVKKNGRLLFIESASRKFYC